MIKELFVLAMVTSLLGGTCTTMAVQGEKATELLKVTKHQPWKIPGEGRCSTTVKTTAEQIAGVDP